MAADPENLDELRFRVVDKDTGQVFRIDEIDQHINQAAYTLIPSRDELAQRLATPSGRKNDDSDDESASPRGGMSASGLSALSSMLGLAKRKDVGKQEAIEGQVRVTTAKKDGPDFGDLKLAQCLQAHDGPIWTMKFSLRGEYLATAGQSGVVYVWAVGATPSSSSSSSSSAAAAAGATGGGGERAAGGEGAGAGAEGDAGAVLDEVAAGPDVVKLLRLAPHRRYVEHSADVIDLSWNKENFLLSASIDKTVRLWHVARAECLHVYPHVDCVTSVDFHPKADHLFVSGNFDKKLRVWNVTDGRVKEWANTPDMITAACFNPEGTMAVAGLYRGQVFFYQTDGMKYYTQVECRNRHGALKGGKKVTGLCYDTSASTSAPGPAFSGRAASASEQLLITTNDSRLRLYQTEDYSMVCKYKGLTNDHMQIKATFSEDAAYVISGSENGHAYIWKGAAPQHGGGGLGPGAALAGLASFKKDRNTAYEFFPATEIGGPNPPIVSVALFVPAAAVLHALKGTPQEQQVAAQHGGTDAKALMNKMVVASDYSGKIRVFQRHSLTALSGAGTATAGAGEEK